MKIEELREIADKTEYKVLYDDDREALNKALSELEAAREVVEACKLWQHYYAGHSTQENRDKAYCESMKALAFYDGLTRSVK